MSTPLASPDRSPAGDRTTGPGATARRLVPPGLLFALPFLVLFVLFMVWPLVQGAWMSLTDTSLSAHEPSFVGLDNYAEALGDADMWRAVGNTVWFTAVSTVPLVAVALGMALLVHTGLPGQWVWRLAFFAPYLLPVGVIGLLWGWLYQPDLGLYNHLLQAAGLDGFSWLSDKDVALYAVVIATPCGGPSASTSCCSWPRSRPSPTTSTRRRPWTGRAPGGGSGTSPCPSCAGSPAWSRCCRSSPR